MILGRSVVIMKDPVEMRSPCARAESASAGHGEEAAGSLVANGDTEEEIPSIPAPAAAPPTIKLPNGEARTSLAVAGAARADSVRSSTSSLARSESSQDTPVSALKSRLSAGGGESRKKVSINEPPSLSVVTRREREAVSPASDKAHHRHSIINISADKRARKVKFYINGDKFFKGAVIAVNNEKFRTFDKLLEHMTKIMCNQVTLPNGVRYIFSLEGKTVLDLDCVLNGESYVCSSLSTFKKLDYVSLAGQYFKQFETNPN